MTVVEPVEAATVIVVRGGNPTGTPWQCFMVRRHALSDFAADVFVFPGGKIDLVDHDPALLTFATGHPGVEVNADGSWAAIRFGAIRELFEEAGILLARRADGRALRIMDTEQARFAGYRRGVHEGSLTMLSLARQEHLVYHLDWLHQLSRWITPEKFPRRFDTHFFVAMAPRHQEPVHDDGETTESVWIAPGDALDRYAAGAFPLVFATEQHLRRLAKHASIEDLIASAAAGDLEPVIPRLVKRNGEEHIVLPGDEDYGAATE